MLGCNRFRLNSLLFSHRHNAASGFRASRCCADFTLDSLDGGFVFLIDSFLFFVHEMTGNVPNFLLWDVVNKGDRKNILKTVFFSFCHNHLE